eukprot:PITA_10860
MENHCVRICKYQASHVDNSPDDHGYPSYGDDAQYFDIDISLPLFPIDTTPTLTSGSSSGEDDSEDEFELDFSISTANAQNPNHSISSPAENVVSDQPTPLLPASTQACNVSGVKIHSPKLFRTATRLKISLFGFRKSGKVGLDLQSPCAEYAGTGSAMDSPVPKQNRLFTMKFKVVEVPLASLFTRDNSKVAKRDGNNGFQEKSKDSDDGEGQCKSMDRDKKRAKEIVQKYVKMIKPLYVKISQRCNEKIRFRDPQKRGERNELKNGRCPGSERSEKQVSFSDFSGNLKMVYKHLGKGRQQTSDMQKKLPNYYTSESTMMEVQSAIQGAISHCKQSSYIDDTSNSPNFECSDESRGGTYGG